LLKAKPPLSLSRKAYLFPKSAKRVSFILFAGQGVANETVKAVTTAKATRSFLLRVCPFSECSENSRVATPFTL
jgi:hypothetical protein